MNGKARLQLGYSSLSKKIFLAKMKDIGGGVGVRVGNDEQEDVTNRAAKLVWELVIDEGGEIHWIRDDGKTMTLKAELI